MVASLVSVYFRAYWIIRQQTNLWSVNMRIGRFAE